MLHRTTLITFPDKALALNCGVIPLQVFQVTVKNAWHTDLYAADDMMVVLGLYTFYDGDSDFYNYGNWWFSQQSGWDGSATVSFMPPMGMYFDLAYGQSEATRLIYYNYNSGDWLTYYWYYVFDGWHQMYFDDQYHTAQVYYLGEQWNWNFNDYNSAEGMTQGAFYYNTVSIHGLLSLCSDSGSSRCLHSIRNSIL